MKISRKDKLERFTKRVRDLKRIGWSYQEISESFNVSKTTIFKALKKITPEEKRRRKRLCDKKYQKRKRANNKGYKTEEYRKWREKNPEKYEAHKKLHTAMAAGKLKKKPCTKCGKTKGVHAHHFDYSKPLNVIWLCPEHHKEIHQKEASLKKP